MPPQENQRNYDTAQKNEVSCGFSHIYWRNPKLKTSFFVQCEIQSMLI